jgi:hypothetical protein
VGDVVEGSLPVRVCRSQKNLEKSWLHFLLGWSRASSLSTGQCVLALAGADALPSLSLQNSPGLCWDLGPGWVGVTSQQCGVVGCPQPMSPQHTRL